MFKIPLWGHSNNTLNINLTLLNNIKTFQVSHFIMHFYEILWKSIKYYEKLNIIWYFFW